MDLEPKQPKPAPDYPTYERFHLSRRAVIGGSATLLLAAGCGTREVVNPPSAPVEHPELSEPPPQPPTSSFVILSPDPSNPGQVRVRTRGKPAHPKMPNPKKPKPILPSESEVKAAVKEIE